MFNKESEEVFNLVNHQFEDLRLKDSIEEFLFLSSFLLLKPTSWKTLILRVFYQVEIYQKV